MDNGSVEESDSSRTCWPRFDWRTASFVLRSKHMRAQPVAQGGFASICFYIILGESLPKCHISCQQVEAMIPKRQISSSERRCPTTKMLASSVPTSSLTMIIVRHRQRTPPHVARGGCACICVPTHVGEYVSEILAWRVVALAPHQSFGAMFAKKQHVGVQFVLPVAVLVALANSCAGVS